MSFRRVLAVARVRALEGFRGPVLVFLLVFLGAATVATLLTPGEPGIDRQRAVDGYVLEAARLLSALAAIALAAASLPGDRDARRDSLLRATTLRSHELLLGGFLGCLACVAALLAGIMLGTLSVTAIFSGGPLDRVPTRVKIPAAALVDHGGERVDQRWTRLTDRTPEATYVVDLSRATLPFNELPEGVTAWIKPREVLGRDVQSVPDTYPVGIRIGAGPERVLQVGQRSPIRFTITPDDLPGSGPLRIRVRRMHPAFLLGLHPEGIAIQGLERPFTVNLLKALAGWLLALLPLAAATTLFSVVVGAPVAVAGSLFLLVFGHSHGMIEDAVHYTEEGLLPLSGFGRMGLEAIGAVTPDLSAYDFSMAVAERWDIEFSSLADRLPPALLGAAALLAGAWGLLTLLRRTS